MKNKSYLKYVNLSILSVLFILPLATALEQTCQISTNISTQVSYSESNQTFNISLETGNFTYNSSLNFSDSKTLVLQRNFSCAYNITIDANISALYSVLNNISSSASIIAKDSADRSAYFLQYTGCLTNLSSCNTNLSILAGKQDFQLQYETCVSDRTSLQGQVNSLSASLGVDPQPNAPGSGSGCKKELGDCRDAQKNDNNWRIGLLILGVVLGYAACYNFQVKPKMGHDDITNQPRQD